MCGGGGQQVPQGYQPAYQGQQDQSFVTNNDQLSSWGSDLYNSVAPQFAQITKNVTDNPYFTSAMSGAGQAAYDAGKVSQQQFGGASTLAGLGNFAAGQAPGVMQGAMDYNAKLAAPAAAYGQQWAPAAAGYGQAYAPVAAAYGQQNAPSAVNYAQATAPMAAEFGAQGAQELNSMVPITTMPELLAGLKTLQTGYDPQNALYNRSYQQMLDQQNAIQSMSGVATSPYGAGVTGDASRNFNIDWQNQQLQRQIAALGAYDQASSTASGNASELIGTASNVLNSGLTTGSNILNSGLTTGSNILNAGINTGSNVLNSGITTGSNTLNSGLSTASGIYNSGVNTGVGAFNTLSGDANESAKNASDLGIAGLNTEATAAQLPYDLYLQNEQAKLAALGSQVSGTNSASGMTDQSIKNSGSYLNIGQKATENAQTAVDANNKEADAQTSGFGDLFGKVLGMFLFS